MSEGVDVKRENFLDIPGCEFRPTGATLEPGLSYEHWERILDAVKTIEGGVQFWLGDILNYGEKEYGEKYAQAVEGHKATGIEVDTLRRYMWVADRVPVVRRLTTLKWSHHDIVASLEPKEQDAWLKRAKSEGLSVRDLKQEIRRARSHALLAQAAPSLQAAEKYSIIYADPPWRYDFAETDNRAIENQYPTMEVEDICALPVQEIAAEDCLLFLWATSPKLREGLQVVEAWGFDYRTCMIWVKDKIGMGYYARQQHELLLIAKKGDIATPLPENRPPSVITAPRTKHSAKPSEFYEALERMYPGLPKIELFCRQPREGWAAWGNEVKAA